MEDSASLGNVEGIIKICVEPPSPFRPPGALEDPRSVWRGDRLCVWHADTGQGHC